MKVENIINNRGNRAANQFVIHHNGDTYFQSYESVIAKYDKDGRLTITPLWDCSNTTRKHLYIFLQRYCNIVQVRYALQSTNKRKAIQDLIDKGIINYSEELE